MTGPNAAPDPSERLVEFGTWINDRARDVLLADGGHAAMFLLMTPDGRVHVELFEGIRQDSAGRSRAEILADAVRRTDAGALAVISEAWSAAEDSVPAGGGARDSASARDILLVAAIDRDGGQIVFETPIRRGSDDALEIGDPKRHGAGFELHVFDEVRAVWAVKDRSG